jgi:hypothetical protein
MAQINANRVGTGTSGNTTPFAKARETGSSAVDSPTGNDAFAVRYFRSSGRGSTIHNFNRTYIHFDTSQITGSIETAFIEIRGVTNTSADIIVISSSAFGGDGGTALSVGDFYNSLNYSIPYSSEVTTWTTGTPANVIELNQTARDYISSSANFGVAVIEYDYDYLDTDPGADTSPTAGIAFGTTIVLRYTEASAGPANVKKLNSVGSQDISKWNGVSWADIVALNSVT